MMGFTKHIKERGTKLVSNIAGNMSPVPPRIDANGLSLMASRLSFFSTAYYGAGF